MINNQKIIETADFEGWKLFAKRWKAGALAALLIGACLSAILFSLTPMYRATLQILLPAATIEDPADRKSSQITQADAVVLRSYDEMIKDDGVARTVIDELKLESNPEFNQPLGHLARTLDWIRRLILPSEGPSIFSAAQQKRDAVLHDYESRMKVINETKSLVLTLSFDASDPFLATQIANAQAKAFVRSQIDRRRAEAAAKTIWMKTELDQAANEVRAEQVALQLRDVATGVSRENSATQAAELRFRQAMVTSRQAVYDTMLARYQNMISEQRYDGSDISILSEASIPTKPAFPKKGLSLAAIAVISLMFGMIITWLVSFFRRCVTAEELAGRLDLPILGKVNFPGRSAFGRLPQSRRLRGAFFWEQIAEIRSTLIVPAHARLPSAQARRRNGANGRVIAVTSPSSGEGKSILAAALAQTTACGGSRTLLLDLNTRPKDLRTNRLPDDCTATGLQDVLSGDVDLSDAAMPVEPNVPLFFLANRPKTAIDVFAMTGPRMRSLIAKARRDFDAIIIDTVGLDVIADTLAICSAVDEVVIAALHEQRMPDAFTAAIEKLRARCVLIKGVVITDHAKPAPDKFARLRPYVTSHRPHKIWTHTSRRQSRGPWLSMPKGLIAGGTLLPTSQKP